MKLTFETCKRFCKPATQLSWWISWGNILLGCIILAAGLVFFINPYNIVPGGVYGTSIVLHNLVPSIQVGTFGYILDVPLLLMSALLLGSKIGARTLFAVLVTPLLMNLFSLWGYPTQEALEQLDPAQLCGGAIDLSQHLMLTTLIGATCMGIGCGIVVRNQGTTGGTDIVGMILQKYCHFRFSHAILAVDATVVCFGLVVIGFGVGSSNETSQPSWYLSFYSLVAIFVLSRVVAYVINGSKDNKLMFVISDKPLPELHRFILNNLDRTATCIKSSGLYSGAEKEMLFLVINHKEVNALKHVIKEIDPKAFVVVTDAYDTFGEGWKQLPSKDEVQPE